MSEASVSVFLLPAAVTLGMDEKFLRTCVISNTEKQLTMFLSFLAICFRRSRTSYCEDWIVLQESIKSR